jgi:hypothetical protein
VSLAHWPMPDDCGSPLDDQAIFEGLRNYWVEGIEEIANGTADPFGESNVEELTDWLLRAPFTLGVVP